MLVDFCDLDAAKIEALLPESIKAMADQKIIPVYLTTLLDYRVFRDHRVIFEPLPPVPDSKHLCPDLNWGFRLRDRRRLIEAKWRPIGYLDLSSQSY